MLVHHANTYFEYIRISTGRQELMSSEVDRWQVPSLVILALWCDVQHYGTLGS